MTIVDNFRYAIRQCRQTVDENDRRSVIAAARRLVEPIMVHAFESDTVSVDELLTMDRELRHFLADYQTGARWDGERIVEPEDLAPMVHSDPAQDDHDYLYR